MRYQKDVLQPEDIALCESVQRGLRSRGYNQYRFIIDRELTELSGHAVHHFPAIVMQAIGGETEERVPFLRVVTRILNIMSTAKEALEKLKSGNRRFTSGQRKDDLFDEKRRAELTQGQAPFAVILGCSDSRVPVEYVFDQGGGDLFVIRVAGNLVEQTQMGSVEFAVTVLGSRLVVVLGHTECGAIKTTLSVMSNPTEDLTPGLSSLVDAIRPAISPVAESLSSSDESTVMSQSIRANVAYNVDRLKNESSLLTPLCESGELMIVGAEYDLESGKVDFFYGG